MKRSNDKIAIPAWKYEALVRDSEMLEVVRKLMETDAYMMDTFPVLLGFEKEDEANEED